MEDETEWMAQVVRGMANVWLFNAIPFTDGHSDKQFCVNIISVWVWKGTAFGYTIRNFISVFGSAFTQMVTKKKKVINLETTLAAPSV